MPNTTFQYERPPFEIPEITADALERGQRVTEALRTLAHQLSFAGKVYDARLLDMNFAPPNFLIAIPDAPINYVAMGWKSHKGKSQLSGTTATTEPVAISKLAVFPPRHFNMHDWTNLSVRGESEHWTPQGKGVDAHQMYELYSFPLNGVGLAVIEGKLE